MATQSNWYTNLKQATIIALFLTISNLNVYGMIMFMMWLTTGMICWKVEWARNVMIGIYIVGGFWYMAASAM